MLPLEGIRILALTSSGTASHGTGALAELGADVVVVEGLAQGDRQQEAMAPGGDFTVDLSKQEGGALLRRLIPDFDVFVVERIDAGITASLSLGYESVKALRADAIMVTLSGHGQDGLAAQLRAGMVAAGAVLTALHYHRRSGKGQQIQLSGIEAAAHVASAQLLDYQMNGREPQQSGSRDSYVAPQGYYRCRGEGQWLAISIRDDAEWLAFCDATGHAEWKADQRFETILDRRRNHDVLDEHIESWTSGQDKYEAMQLLESAGVPAAAVRSPNDAPPGAHSNERRPEEQGGWQAWKNLVAKFSGFETRPHSSAPAPGQQPRKVLIEAGFSQEEIAELEAQGVIR